MSQKTKKDGEGEQPAEYKQPHFLHSSTEVISTGRPRGESSEDEMTGLRISAPEAEGRVSHLEVAEHVWKEGDSSAPVMAQSSRVV